MTTALTFSHPNFSPSSSRLTRISATTTSTVASGFTLRLPVTNPTESRGNPHASAASCTSWYFCSVRAISGVV